MSVHNPQLVPFHNPKSETVRFTIGSIPGSPAEEHTIKPGETFLGWPAYERFYVRHGLKKGESPTAPKAPAAERVEPPSVKRIDEGAPVALDDEFDDGQLDDDEF